MCRISIKTHTDRRWSHLNIGEAIEPWSDIVENSSHGSIQGESEAEEDGEDEVGEDGGEVDGLAKALHPFDQRQENDQPGQKETSHQLQTQSSYLQIARS